MAKYWKFLLFGGIILLFVWGGSSEMFFRFGILVYIVPLVLIALGVIGMVKARKLRAEEDARKAAEAQAAYESQRRESARQQAERAARAEADRAAREKREAEWRAEFDARRAAREAAAAEKAARREGSRMEEYAGAGVSRRQSVFRRHGDENPDYRLSKSELAESGITYDIPQYEFDDLSFSLEREPDNEYDPNAVKILINGDMVGYIPAEDSAHVSRLIDSGSIVDVDGYVVGGPLLRYDPLDDSFEKVHLTYGVRVQIYIGSGK